MITAFVVASVLVARIPADLKEHAGTEVNGLVMGLKASAKELKPGQTVTLTLTLTNLTGAAFQLGLAPVFSSDYVSNSGRLYRFKRPHFPADWNTGQVYTVPKRGSKTVTLVAERSWDGSFVHVSVKGQDDGCCTGAPSGPFLDSMLDLSFAVVAKEKIEKSNLKFDGQLWEGVARSNAIPMKFPKK